MLWRKRRKKTDRAVNLQDMIDYRWRERRSKSKNRER